MEREGREVKRGEERKREKGITSFTSLPPLPPLPPPLPSSSPGNSDLKVIFIWQMERIRGRGDTGGGREGRREGGREGGKGGNGGKEDK